MNGSDETLKKSPDTEVILQAIAKLSRKFDDPEKFLTAQFDAVPEGIAYSSAKFDRPEAKFYEAISDISNMRAGIKELAQVVRKKELV
jgi:hypothetical protein